MGIRIELAKKCPDKYRANSVKYFMMDTKHPNKLLFFNIGQDNFSAGLPHIWTTDDGKHSLNQDYSWDQTIRFIK